MGKGQHLGEFEEIVLLAVARLRDEGHGAAIHRVILEVTGRDVSIAAVYVTLSRLEEKGYVASSVALPGEERGGRPRKVFALTESAVAGLRRSRVIQDRLWDGLAFDPLTSEA